MRSYLRRIAIEARRALNVLAIAACCCHADPSPLSNDGSPNASVPGTNQKQLFNYVLSPVLVRNNDRSCAIEGARRACERTSASNS